MSHKVHRAGPLPCVLVPRTCSKCGARFGSAGRENQCVACHAPKERAARKYETSLSPREESIVALIAQSKSNKIIAHELCLTTGTIKEYLFTIFQKLHLPNRTAVAVWFLTRPPVPVVVPH